METTEVAAAGGVAVILIIAYIAVIVFMLVTMWKIFAKAGQPGWACIVPIYNVIVMLQIAGKPGWWILLMMFVPFANIVVAILMLVGLARNFGKGGGYVVGMILLPIVFYPMLAFGSAEYAPVEA